MCDRYNQSWVMMFAQGGATRWAITIGQTTYYSCPKEQVTPGWANHEAVHRAQWAALGWRFAVKYLANLAKYGYRDNPYEVEARNSE